MKEEITAFWNWFEVNKSSYENFGGRYKDDYDQVNKLLDELVTELQKISAGLFVEIGGKEGDWELIITPQGVASFFAAAYEVVAAAPKIKGWVFHATKPAYGPDFNFKMGDIEINPSSISFIPLESKEEAEAILIRVFHDDYTETDEPRRKAVIMGIYQALDSLLGEVATTFDIDHIEFAQAPDDGVEALPLSELVGYIKWKKKERAVSGVHFPEEEVTLLRGEREAMPVMVLVNNSLKYYEFKNDFPYLLLVSITFNEVSDQGFPVESMDEVYAIEDKINEVVCANEKGHFLSTETFDGSRKMYYAGKTKETLEAQIDFLKREVKSSYSIDYEIVYDLFWVKASAYM